MEISHQGLCEFISQRRKMADSDSQIVEALLADPNCVTHVSKSQFVQETSRSADYISAGTLDAILDGANQVYEGIGRAKLALSSLLQVGETVESGATIVTKSSNSLSVSINEIARQAEAILADVNEVLTRTSEAFVQAEYLKKSAAEITNIVSLVKKIAGQTNLLALNATIEAARAGDLGRGFAVVAGEVKALAQQASSATEDIASQIGKVQSTSDESAEHVRAIQTSITSIGERMAIIAVAVQKQEIVAANIASSTTQTTSGVRQLRETVEMIGKNAEKNAIRALDVVNGLSVQGVRGESASAFSGNKSPDRL